MAVHDQGIQRYGTHLGAASVRKIGKGEGKENEMNGRINMRDVGYIRKRREELSKGRNEVARGKSNVKKDH